MIKTKNILKIGVFSIVILSLLISPTLKFKISEVKAQNFAIGPNAEELKLHFEHFESSAEDLCKGVGDDSWLHAFTLAYWEHLNCVIQKSIIAALGTSFSAMVNSLIGWILWAFSPATYGGFSTNTAVLSVWKSMRNLVNLFLALGLVFIALATILGIKKYSWQQTLWKLVVVALLVNFSLVMAGMILDVSHFFAYSFLTLAKGDNQIIAESLIKSFETEKLDEDAIYSIPGIDTTTPTSTKGWGLSWGGALTVILVLLIIIVFTFLSLLSVFAAMLVRSFFIVALLCLSPIAFASWIFPDTEKYWKMWWQQFIKWCTYPVIFALMFWIGISVIIDIEPGKGVGAGVMASILRILLFSMFLVGGLIFSIQGGGATAQFVMKQGSKVRAFVGTKIKERTIESRPYKFAGRVLTKIPLLKVMGEEMMIAGEKSKTARIKENEKNLENISLGTLKQLEKSPLPSPLERGAYEQRIALTNRLAKMGVLGDKSIEFIKLHMQDRSFDQLTISRAVPQHFRIKDGFFGKTGPSTREKVQALGGIKENKILELTQAKEFLMDQVNEAKKQAEKAGKSEKEIEDIKTQKFDEIIQEIIGTLNPAQVNAFWRAISAKTLIEEGWGGPDGKIIQAIDKLDETKKKFREEMLPLSRALQEISGITPPKVIKEKIELYDMYGRKINK